MRTTPTLAPDVLAAARKLAEERSESLGKVVSDLMRRGLEAAPTMKSGSGLPMFKVSGTASPLCLADVKRDEDEA